MNIKAIPVFTSSNPRKEKESTPIKTGLKVGSAALGIPVAGIGIATFIRKNSREMLNEATLYDKNIKLKFIAAIAILTTIASTIGGALGGGIGAIVKVVKKPKTTTEKA